MVYLLRNAAFLVKYFTVEDDKYLVLLWWSTVAPAIWRQQSQVPGRADQANSSPLENKTTIKLGGEGSVNFSRGLVPHTR